MASTKRWTWSTCDSSSHHSPRRSLPGSSRSFCAASTTSPRRSVEFSHSRGSFSVVEATYFFMAFHLAGDRFLSGRRPVPSEDVVRPPSQEHAVGTLELLRHDLA